MSPSTASTLRGAALRGVKVSAALADRLRPRRAGVVFLLYHRVGGGSGGEGDLPADLFERQMEALAATGRAAPIGTALAALDASPRPDADPVVVTFDDGTADLTDVAAPILERHGIPWTVYLATHHVERGVPFPRGARPLSWAALRDARATGLVTVGSHTHTHAVLDRLPHERIAAELDRSRDLIADRLGVEAEHFAYPKGVAGSAVAAAAVRSRFRSAALGTTGANLYGRTDAFRLRRSPIQASDGMRWFRRKLDGGMALEGSLRELLNRRRYAEVVT